MYFQVLCGGKAPRRVKAGLIDIEFCIITRGGFNSLGRIYATLIDSGDGFIV